MQEHRMTATTQSLPTYPWMDLNRDCPLDPPPLFTRLRVDEPVARIRTAMGNDAWLVTRHEDARFVLGDQRFSADRRRPGFPHVGPPRPVPPGNFVHIDSPEHTRLRRFVSRNFTVKTVDTLRPKIQRFIDEIVDDIASGTPPVDLKATLALPVPVRVISELIGIPPSGAHIFTTATRFFMPTTTPTGLAIEKINEVREYVDQLVTAKKREPGDDLISRLAMEQESQGALSHAELVGLALVLMFGGYETTSNMIALALLLLMQHPDQLAQLQKNPKLVKSAIEEVLRYITVVHTGLPRIATEDVEVGGQRIRAGEGVIVSLGSANRDDAAFDNAARFDIHRFASHREAHHLAFGHGIHQCIGQMLARLQLQMVVSTVLERVPTMRLAVPIEDVPFRHDMFLYGVHQLLVTW
jgi:cytochrome P450